MKTTILNDPTPSVFADWCDGSGLFEICHPSTDALIGYHKCEHPVHKMRVWKAPEPFWRGEWKKAEQEKMDEPPF